MGLDDLVDDEKEEVEEDQTESVKDKLGVEDKEDLEDIDDRISKCMELLIKHDKMMETLTKNQEIIRDHVASLVDEKESPDDGAEDVDPVDEWLDGY